MKRAERDSLALAAYRQCAADGLTRAETAAKMDVSYSAVKSVATRHGIEFAAAPYVSKSCQPVRIRGVDYPSQAAAARAIGIAHQTLTQHLDRGTPDRAGLRWGRQVRLNGAEYPSITVAAEATGLTRSAVIYRLERDETQCQP